MISKRQHYGINFGYCQQFLYQYSSCISGIFGTISIKSLCFISTIPVHYTYSNIKVSKQNFVFISLTFIFHIILQAFKETSFNQLLSGAMPLRVTNTENSVITESNLEGHKSPFWVSVNLSGTFETWMKLTKQYFCVNISRREKDWT